MDLTINSYLICVINYYMTLRKLRRKYTNSDIQYRIALSHPPLRSPRSPQLTMTRDSSKTEITNNHTPNIHTSLFQTIRIDS